jgi:hypothetical protein
MFPFLAYIDPGSGSLIIQAAIAAVIAIPIFFRSQIARAVRALRGSDDNPSELRRSDDNPSTGGDDAASV